MNFSLLVSNLPGIQVQLECHAMHATRRLGGSAFTRTATRLANTLYAKFFANRQRLSRSPRVRPGRPLSRLA